MRRDDHGQGFSPANPDNLNPADERLPDELASVVQWYQSQHVPEPTSEAMPQRVMTRLHAEAMAAVRVSPQGRQPILHSLRQSLRMARWQFTLFGPSFWITGAMVLVLGVGAGPFLPHTVAITLLIYALPLTAVLCAVYALRRVAPGLRDLEKSSPTGFVEMMTGVVLALVGCNVMLGVVATAALSLAHWAPFGTLVASWLAPLLLFVALSFPVALRWGTGPALLVGGGPWLALILGAFARSGVLSASFLLATQPGWLLCVQLCATGAGAVILGLLFLRGFAWKRALILA